MTWRQEECDKAKSTTYSCGANWGFPFLTNSYQQDDYSITERFHSSCRSNCWFCLSICMCLQSGSFWPYNKQVVDMQICFLFPLNLLNNHVMWYPHILTASLILLANNCRNKLLYSIRWIIIEILLVPSSNLWICRLGGSFRRYTKQFVGTKLFCYFLYLKKETRQ